MVANKKSAAFCPTCNSLLKPSPRGPVCRNSHCDLFVSYSDEPITKINAQPVYVPSHLKNPNSETVVKRAAWCCPKAFFDVRTFFESMVFIGSMQSKINEYYCYRFNDMYMASTGIRELSRFNAIHINDLRVIENLISRVFGSHPFTGQQLRDACLKENVDSDRMRFIKFLIQQNQEEHNDLYWLMLEACYCLTVGGKLVAEKRGRGIEFVKCLNGDKPTIIEKNIFKDIRYLFNVNENTAVFETGPFFLQVRCTGYRGSIGPYIDEEIDYLNELVESYPQGKQLDIEDLIYSMDYSYRFHRLYDLLGWKNLRNDREEMVFFDRRIKSGLELVAKFHNNIRIEKDGRKKIFIKR